jgi:hypothetical protein
MDFDQHVAIWTIAFDVMQIHMKTTEEKRCPENTL